MITYDKGWWGNRVLFRAYGSAFPRSLLYSCMAAALAAALSAVFRTTGWELFNNPYPLQLFFFVVGFMVIFRCAFSGNYVDVSCVHEVTSPCSYKRVNVFGTARVHTRDRPYQ